MSFDYTRVHFNTWLLVKELISRWVSVSYLGTSPVLIAEYEWHTEYLDETNTNLIPYTTKFILDNKYTTKEMLKRIDISVAKGAQFDGEDLNGAIEFAQKVWFPLVIKPSMWSHGIHVHININTREEFLYAFRTVAAYIADNPFVDVLIEDQFEWEECRVYIDTNWFYAVSRRTPANITGDGQHTLHQLIEAENYRRMNPRTTCLCTIKLDDILHKHLTDQWKTLDYIPAEWENVVLRPSSNVCMWGNCHDVTDIVHPSVIDIAKQILSGMPQLPYIGIDIMSTDITAPQTPESYIICELNTNPGLSLHTHEETGAGRNVPGALCDLIFPETAS